MSQSMPRQHVNLQNNIEPEDSSNHTPSTVKICPKCGATVERLYRTPRGLRCASCVRKMDSSGLGFQ